MSAFSEIDLVTQAIVRKTHAEKITLTTQQTIDRLWQIALAVGMEDGEQYQTVRNAIAWLEVMRNG